MLGNLLGFLKKRLDLRGEWHSMRSPLFHFFGRNDKHVSIYPVPTEFGDFARPEHRAQRQEKDDLNLSRGVGDNAHHLIKLLPRNGRHRCDDRGGIDAIQSVDRIVLDVSGTYSKVEYLSASHDETLERYLLARLLHGPQHVDDERGRDLVQLS